MLPIPNFLGVGSFTWPLTGEGTRRSHRHQEPGTTGWWLSPTPLKNDGVKVSWDYEIPEDVEKKHVPNHQLAINNGM